MYDNDKIGLGLSLTVYRAAGSLYGDGTLGGMTSKAEMIVLVGIVDYTGRDRMYRRPDIRPVPRDCRVSTPGDDAPAAWLVVDKHRPSDRFVIPADESGRPDMRHYMDGGNYVRGDSRFLELIGWHGAVRVHDRYEG